jgi:hypothetical protein
MPKPPAQTAALMLDKASATAADERRLFNLTMISPNPDDIKRCLENSLQNRSHVTPRCSRLRCRK